MRAKSCTEKERPPLKKPSITEHAASKNWLAFCAVLIVKTIMNILIKQVLNHCCTHAHAWGLSTQVVDGLYTCTVGLQSSSHAIPTHCWTQTHAKHMHGVM